MNETVENFVEDSIEVEGNELYVVPNHSSYYVDLDAGKVWNNKKQRWITANPNANGYCYATIYDDFKEPVRISIHNIVMMAYMGCDKSAWRARKLEIHHLDNDKSNNCIENLALTTRKLQYQCEITKATIANRSTKKLSIDDVVSVKTAWMEWEGSKGEFYSKWADKLEVTNRSIQNIIIGQTYGDVVVN